MPFLRYISPTWYFNLPAAGAFAYFPDYDLLPEAERALIQWDAGYSHAGVARLDAAYQAWHKGFIGSDTEKGLNCSNIQPTLSDNYRFVHRHFHPLWSWYILLLRLLSFRNPFREIGAFLRQRKVKRVSLYARVYPHEEAFRKFESPSVAAAPKVSVIIPTLNRYVYLKDALHDLEQQDYPHFEVIVVDQSEPFQPEFYKQFHLDIQLIRQEEKALWLARNTAIKAASAEWIALYEDDVRIPKNWLSNHLKCLDFFQADISAGVFFPEGSVIPAGRNFFRWADQFATGNACLKKEVFRQIGLFDRQFERQRMGDGEFGLRAYLAGFKSISNPLAWCEDVKASHGGLRQMGSWDGFRPKSWLAPRPVPSVLYLVRKYFGNKAALHTIFTGVSTSLIPYRFKRSSKLMMAGIVLFLVLSPFVLIQIYRSWQISGKMLREGAKIPDL
jgi:GT2 family glycosyltransferase